MCLFGPAESFDTWVQLTDSLSSPQLDVTELQQFWLSFELDAGLSSFPVGSSSDDTERGEGLREEEEDKGSGEPSSEELQLRLEEARAGDWEQRMTEGLSLSSLCGLGGKFKLAWAMRFFFSRGEMTSAATAEGMWAVQGLDVDTGRRA